MSCTRSMSRVSSTPSAWSNSSSRAHAHDRARRPRGTARRAGRRCPRPWPSAHAPASSRTTPSRSPPRPIRSGWPSRSAAASSTSMPAGQQHRPLRGQIVRRATSAAGAAPGRRARARARRRRARARRASAATPRCRRPRPRGGRGTSSAGERRSRGRAHASMLRGRRRVGAAAPRQRARADRGTSAPGDARRHRADRDLGRHAADVDDRDRPVRRRRRASASRPRTPAAPRPRPDSTRRRRRPRSRSAATSASRLAACGSPRWRRRAGAPRRRLGRGALARDDLGDGRDRRLRDRALRVDAAADAGERALLEHRAAARARRSATSSRVVFDPMSMQAQRMDVAQGCHDGRRCPRDVAIEVEDPQGLRRHRAVRGISFTVRRGEVFGLLGPNGAGKTTTVEILEGYRSAPAAASPCSAWTPGRATGAARADRHRAAVQRAVPAPDRARGGQPLGRPLAAAARRRGDDRASPGSRLGREADAHALGRPAAAARLRARAGRRPRARLPRRADDRLRPRRAAPGVGHRALAAASSARPCCSPRTTSTRRRRWPTASRSSRTARSSPRAPRRARRRRALPGDVARRGRRPARARDRRPDGAAARADRRRARARGGGCTTSASRSPASRTSTSS